MKGTIAMHLRAKSNLKTILDERGISIQQFARDTGLKFETLRRLYHDDTRQYQRDTIGIVCQTLDIGIEQLLTLIEKSADPLADEIELLDLDPEIFNKVRRQFPKVKTVGELMEEDISKISEIGLARLEVLNKTLKEYVKRRGDQK